MAGELKYFSVYIKLLKSYARAHGIKVQYPNMPDCADYNDACNRIRLDKELPEKVLIATFLHELGHAIDFLIVAKRRPTRALYGAYGQVYEGVPTKGQLAIVLKSEKDAWIHGEAIAKVLKIRLGRWYYKEKELCLKSYKSTKIRVKA